MVSYITYLLSMEFILSLHTPFFPPFYFISRSSPSLRTAPKEVRGKMYSRNIPSIASYAIRLSSWPSVVKIPQIQRK